jgi:DNA polymerase-4
VTDATVARPRWFLHVDLDQFIAAVEVRRRPELRGRPVVVGGNGDPTQRRQVVATASYEARAFGVQSGMPMATALRRCPQAVFLPTDRDAYEAASAEVFAVVRRFTPLVEVWGWDEGFVGTDEDPPEDLAQRVRAAVRAETGISCCVGIGDNKLRAKLATGFAKAPFGAPVDAAPGVYRLTRDTWFAVMGDRPTSALWGVGTRTAAKLAEAGVGTVSELAAADLPALADRFGPSIGPWLGRLGRGLGDATISTEPWVARSRSREATYEHDLVDSGEIAARVRELAADVGGGAVADGRTVTHVAVKVRFAPFLTRTRVTRLAAPTTSVTAVEEAALLVLGRFELDRPVRLLGVRVDLAPPDSPTPAPTPPAT